MTSSANELGIFSAAAAVRRALEVRGRETAGTNYALLQRFPHGACDTASRLLARYLLDERLQTSASIQFCVNGTRRKVRGRWKPARYMDDGAQTHAWLEAGGLIIDITADQFEDGPAPVLVTRDRSWHSSFARQELRTYDTMMQLDEHYASDFETVYRLIRP